jgi:hypothetical protein
MSATTSALRNIARANMKRAGLTQINKKDSDGRSYFAKTWRFYCQSAASAQIRKLREEERRRNARTRIALQKVELRKTTPVTEKKQSLIKRIKIWLIRLAGRLTGY